MSKFNEATITKENNTLLPTGYIQWRKDIEQLIDTAKLKTVISVNMGTLSLLLEYREKYPTETRTGRLGQTGYRATIERFDFSLSE